MTMPDTFQQPKAPDGMDHCMGCAHRLGTNCGCPCCTLPPPLAPPGAVELNATAAAWYQALLAADDEIGRLKEIRDRAAEHVQAAMGDAVEARIGGRPVVTWKPAKPGTSLDRKALEAAYGADVIEGFVRVNKAARPFKVLPPDGA